MGVLLPKPFGLSTRDSHKKAVMKRKALCFAFPCCFKAEILCLFYNGRFQCFPRHRELPRERRFCLRLKHQCVRFLQLGWSAAFLRHKKMTLQFPWLKWVISRIGTLIHGRSSVVALPRALESLKCATILFRWNLSKFLRGASKYTSLLSLLTLSWKKTIIRFLDALRL